MDQKMNEYDGCQTSYQGCEMDQGMNGYDEYQSSSQGCEYGYDVQQEYCIDNQEAYTNNQEAYPHQQWDNQGMYHQQQWNDNYQDSYNSPPQYQEPCSSSSQRQESFLLSETFGMLKEAMEEYTLMKAKYEELNDRFHKMLGEQREKDEGVLSVVDEMMESPIEEEIQPMVSSSSKSKATLKAHCNVTHQSHIDKMQLEENEKFLEDFSEQLASPNDEECAKGGSNELTPKVLDLPKVKESLQTLLESNDLGEFHSKVGHLKFILESKEMLGDLLQEFEEEQSSNLYMRTLFKEAPSMEKKEIDRSKEILRVEDMVETTEMVRHDLPLVMKQKEKLKPLKHAKRRRRKKPKGTKGRGIESKPPLLTFTPLRFIDGKLECNVRSSKGIKPFAKVKVLLSSSSQDNEGGMISEKMARMFNMKLGDHGPRPPYDPPPLHH